MERLAVRPSLFDCSELPSDLEIEYDNVFLYGISVLSLELRVCILEIASPEDSCTSERQNRYFIAY